MLAIWASYYLGSFFKICTNVKRVVIHLKLYTFKASICFFSRIELYKKAAFDLMKLMKPSTEFYIPKKDLN